MSAMAGGVGAVGGRMWQQLAAAQWSSTHSGRVFRADHIFAASHPARPGEWSNVEVPLDRFLLTWRGKLVETRMEMNPRRVGALA